MKQNYTLVLLTSCLIASGCTTIGQQIINRDGTIQIKQENVDLNAQSGSNPPYSAIPSTPITTSTKNVPAFIVDERTPAWQTALQNEFRVSDKYYILTERDRKVLQTGVDIIPVNTNNTTATNRLPAQINVYTDSVNISN